MNVSNNGQLQILGCNISSNMNCCEEVKQRIAMAKKAYNRKKEFSAGPWKRGSEETCEVFCVECSVVWCRDLDIKTE